MDDVIFLTILSLFASVMVAFIVLILYYIEKIKTYIGVFFIYFGLLMMLTMFIGAVIYLYSPSNTSLAIAFGVNMAIMVSVLAYFFIVAEKIASQRFNGEKKHILSFAILVVLNEILMGTTFSLAQFGLKYFLTLYDAFNTSINSVWFFYPMMAEMLAIYLIHYLKGFYFKELFPLIGIATFPPTVFNFTDWVYSSLVLSLGFSLLGVLTAKNIWRYIYIVLAIGTITTLLNPVPYDLIIIFSMILYYRYVLSATQTNL